MQALSVNPGAVLSDVWRHWPDLARRLARPAMAALLLSTSQGAAPAVAAASQWRLEGPAGTGQTHPSLLAGPIAADGAAHNSEAVAEGEAEAVELAGGQYLVPYHVLSHAEPVATLLELVGPFAGVRVALPNALVEDERLARGLWNASLHATAAAAAAYARLAEAACPVDTRDAAPMTGCLTARGGPWPLLRGLPLPTAWGLAAG